MVNRERMKKCKKVGTSILAAALIMTTGVPENTVLASEFDSMEAGAQAEPDYGEADWEASETEENGAEESAAEESDFFDENADDTFSDGNEITEFSDETNIDVFSDGSTDDTTDALSGEAGAEDGAGDSAENPIEVPAEGLIFKESNGQVRGISNDWFTKVNPSGNTLYVKVKIPKEIDGTEVKAIVGYVFSRTGNGWQDKNSAPLGKIKIVSVDFSEAENLTSIGDYAFYDRPELAGTIDLSKTSVREIGSGAFKCSSITGAVLTDTLEILGDMNIGAGVFSECKELRSVKYASYTGNRPVALPDTLVQIGKQCFRNSFPSDMSFAVDIPKSVANIGAEAFNTNNNNSSSRVSTIYIKRTGDYSGYDKYAFQNGKSFIVFPDAMDYNEAIRKINNSSIYTPTYELNVVFKKRTGDAEENVATQKKLYNQYFYYEKREDDVWAVKEDYTFPEVKGIVLKNGYEMNWYFEDSQESVSEESRAKDVSPSPEEIHVLTKGVKICMPKLNILGPHYVCEGSDITLKAEITNKAEDLHYEYVWAKWDDVTNEWRELEGETKDTLQVTEGDNYYLAAVTAYDDEGNQSEQAGEFVSVSSRQHKWAYTSEENKITVKCTNSECKYEETGVTSVLQAEDMVYSGKPYDLARFGTEVTDLTGVTASAIQYFKKDFAEALKEAPTEVGEYQAYVELSNGEKAWKVFRITKAKTAPKVTIKGWTYGDNANKPEVSGNIEKGAENFTYYTDSACTVPTGSENGAAEKGAVPKNAGTYYVKAETGETKNYMSGFAVAAFQIAPKEVTVILDSAKKFTGESDPQLTYKASGLVGNDALSGITVTRKAGEKIGQYDIIATISESANPNYRITFQKAAFTIEQGDQSKLNGKAVARLNLPILLAKGKGGNRRINLSWLKYSGADGYEAYWCYCNGTANYKKFATIKNGKLTATHKNLKSNREYKYFVVAYKMVDGRKIYLAKSNTLHVAMKQAKTTNASSVTVNKRKITLTVGKTFTLKCKTRVEDNKKSQLSHTSSYRYYTTNKKVATVTKNGVIKARGKGRCTMYVLANNGVYKRIKVTVK